MAVPGQSARIAGSEVVVQSQKHGRGIAVSCSSTVVKWKVMLREPLINKSVLQTGGGKAQHPRTMMLFATSVAGEIPQSQLRP